MKLTNIAILFCLVYATRSADLPCRARDLGIEGRSIVCVCNAEYCDTITREEPEPGTFAIYTSNDAGLRFAKSSGVIEIEEISDDETFEELAEEFPEPDDREYNNRIGNIIENLMANASLRVFLNTRHQYIEGFGGSVTDAASINWRKLSDGAQTQFINTYFGPEGIEYNLIRVPIAGCDFSTHPYTYNEQPWNDGELTNYTLTSEDLFFKLPMIKRSQAVATDEIKITASTWSPPIWMKTNENITGFGQLKPEFYQSYANYHMKFIEEYKKAEVDIWAVTTTNEPINGIVPFVRFNSLGWRARELGRWVADNLGPTIRNSQFNKTLILAVDDQRYLLPLYLRGMEDGDPKSIEYMDGIAVHYYGNFIPAAILSLIQRRYPGKILLATEACEGAMPWDAARVEIGSWERARRYATYIMQDLNNFVVGWIDWNLALDPEGGPNWAYNFVDAPILVYGDQDEFIKQPMYYAMGHFSKFIPRGSRRVQVSQRSLAPLENVGFLTPNGNLVLVLQNRRATEMPVEIRLSSRRIIKLTMEPKSIKTLDINLG